MAYHFSFADNEIYSATDVNNITKRLVTAGVADSFTDGVAYNLSSFNEMGTLLYASGVVPETVQTLKVTLEEDTVLIYPGTAFFEDGAVIEIEEGGHTLSRIPDAINYVYLKNDLINTNSCYPVCSVEAPTGDTVLLAEISADGVVTDKRVYAKGKLPGYASNAGYVMQINDTVQIPPDVLNLGSTTYYDVIYNIGNNNYQYLLAVQDGKGSSYRMASLYRFKDDTYNSFAMYNEGMSYPDGGAVYLYHDTYKRALAKVSMADGKLTLSIMYGVSTEYTNHNFPIQLYLF